MRVVAVVLALLATPLLHGFCFPPARVHLLAWIAFVPWFVAIRLVEGRRAMLVSALTTLAGSWLVVTWLPSGVANYYGQPLVVGIVLFAGVWAVTVAPWIFVFTAAYRGLARRVPGWLLPLLAGAAWAAAELGRARLLVRDPFGLLGYSQMPVESLVQVADVTGVYGVSVVVAAVNAALAELCIARRERRGAALGGLALAGLAVVGFLGYGRARLASPGSPPATRVAVVQANLDLGTQWRSEFYGRNFEAYGRLTAGTLRTERPAVVFWPESALTFFLESEPTYRVAIAQLLSTTGAELLTGGPRADGNGARYYNSAFLVAPDGQIAGRYDKRELLPFAEYFPFASIGLLRREFARVREFTPGPPSPPLSTAAGSAGVLVCNEAMFPETAAERVRAGAQYLVVLTNDSWLGDPKYAEQAFEITRLRAIEQRRWMVRASTSGPSAIVDPYGRVVARTPLGSQVVASGMIGIREGLTPYGRLGDAFGVACAAAVLAGLLSSSRRPEAPRE